MHDFHLADLIYKAILEEAEKNQLKKVTHATIELGTIIEHGEAVQPENLEFNLTMLAQGGMAEGLAVEIIKSTGSEWVLREIEGE